MATESPVKMIKNVFNFTLTTLFSRYLNFCLDFLVMYKMGLIKKIRLISKFITSHLGEQKIAIHILTNISRNKANHAIRFSQLLEYNIRNIFLENS